MKTVKKTHWLLVTICVLLVCCIVGVAISAVQFRSGAERTYASATIQFSFPEAADGLAPNGYPFNVEDIRSEEMIDAALEAAGLADQYAAADIQQMIRVQGSYPENIQSQLTSYTSLLDTEASQAVTASDYHPTTYSVTLYQDFDPDISDQDLQNLLSCLLKAYRDYFARTSAMGTSTARLDQDFADDDYPQALSTLSVQIQRAAEYAREMSAKDATLKVDGQTFSDIGIQLGNLVNTDIARMNGLVSTYALTKDASRLQAQYEYEIQTRANELEKKKEHLKRLEQLVQAYQKSVAYVTTTDALVKVETSSSATYDKLNDAKRQLSDEIATLNTEIATYQLRLNDLMKVASAEVESAASVEDTNVNRDIAASAEAANEVSAASSEEAIAESEAAAAAEAANEVSESTVNLEGVDISAQVSAIETGIARLQSRQSAITTQFNTLIQAYNDQEINDGTVSISAIRLRVPSLMSGTFLVRALKTAGPLCALGLMLCLVLIIRSRAKEQKRNRENQIS